MAIRRCYLVDTENVKTIWKELLCYMTKQDTLLLFYTEKSPGIGYEDLQYILQYAGSFEMIKCYMGKNGLDFQLVTYLGYLLKSAPKTEYYIISNDSGYEAAIKFWTQRERVVARLTISELMKHIDRMKKKQEKLPEKMTAEELSDLPEEEQEQEIIESRKIIDLFSDTEKEEILGLPEDILLECLEDKYRNEENLQTILQVICDPANDKLQKQYQGLVKEFGMEDGAQIYRSIKPQAKRLRDILQEEQKMAR